ncbi:MAG TPA: membrane protein insertion efficiency factor YidD [Blastocatellia bacterium]|nr:membrane protein insertion efficiency factor YidD [Blastocatellia bacterium]
MYALQQQPPAGERKVSTLRKRLGGSKALIIITVLLCLLIFADTFRAPSNQITAFAYIGAVRLYQRFGRPLLKGHVECRYDPTCSEYSLQAVQKYGIRYGLVLTYKRLSSCTTAVPKGTSDPVL